MYIIRLLSACELVLSLPPPPPGIHLHVLTCKSHANMCYYLWSTLWLIHDLCVQCTALFLCYMLMFMYMMCVRTHKRTHRPRRSLLRSLMYRRSSVQWQCVVMSMGNFMISWSCSVSEERAQIQIISSWGTTWTGDTILLKLCPYL